jgi:NTP pyrophosphatase (non-canonical NTP hydrolase)
MIRVPKATSAIAAVLAMNASLDTMQDGVWEWCQKTFDGVAEWQTDKERAYRFFEEAGELFQAIGMTRDDAVKVVDYVFGRPIGERSQEIGGVMITLLALASQQDLNVAQSLANEYVRINQPDIVTKIREKQRAKNQAFL